MTALNQVSCNCGARLYVPAEVARGICNKCHVMGSVTSTVALPSSVTGSVTKQQKYRAKNPEKTKADTAARVARWRDGQRRRRA